MLVVRYNHNQETLLELSRTEKYVRCITMLDSVRDIREMPRQYKEVINKVEVARNFNQDWLELFLNNVPYPPVRWIVKALTGYIPLTERARKELIMLVLSIITQEDGTNAITSFNNEKAAINASPTGAEVVTVTEEFLGEFTKANLARIFNILVPEDQQITAFANKADGVKRVVKAAKIYVAANKPEKVTKTKTSTVPREKKHGAVAIVHETCEANPGMERKELIALLEGMGINKSTAATQIQVYRKTHPENAPMKVEKKTKTSAESETPTES